MLPKGPEEGGGAGGRLPWAKVTLPTPITPYLLFSNTVTRLDTEASFSLLFSSILQASRVPEAGREASSQHTQAAPTWGHR